MPTTLFSAIVPDVIVGLPGVSSPLAEDAIKKAAIEFCEKSLAWTHEHDPVTVAANVNPYDYAKPANTVVVRPLQAWLNKREVITYKTPGELSELLGDWRAAKGTPSFITQVRPSQFYLVPMPASTIPNGLTLRIALKPSRASTGLETFLYEDYLEGIAAGARARLLGMPSVPWRDPGAADLEMNRFNDHIRMARDRVQRGYGPAARRVRPQFF